MHAVRRAAHDAIEDDDVSVKDRLGVIQDVRDAERTAIVHAFFTRELARVRLVSGEQLDDLTRVGAGL